MNDKIAELNERITAATDGPPLATEDKIRACYVFAGHLTGIHEKLDAVRDGFDNQNDIDHNVEQAQISVEVALMRLGQVIDHLQGRLPARVTAPAGDPLDYWTVQQVADKLNVSKMTVYRMTEDGKLPSFKVGRHIRITKEAFANYLEGLQK